MIDGVFLFDSLGGVTAQNITDMSGACYPSCDTFVEGSFIGPGSVSMPGMPNNIGVEYDIQETDVITGVVGFSYDTISPVTP